MLEIFDRFMEKNQILINYLFENTRDRRKIDRPVLAM